MMDYMHCFYHALDGLASALLAILTMPHKPYLDLGGVLGLRLSVSRFVSKVTLQRGRNQARQTRSN